MSELKLYQKNKIGWVFYLMHKYLTGARFKPVIDAMSQAATDEEKQAARAAWEDRC